MAVEASRDVASPVDHGPAIAESLKGLFGGYLRTCRSGGMPRKLSDQAQGAFDNFCRVYEREIYAAILIVMRSVSGRHPKGEDAQAAECAACQSGGAAETPSNQSLQEGMVLWPKYPTEAMFKRLGDLTQRDDIGFQTFNGDTGNWAWLLGELRLAASPSSISQEQEKGNE